MGLPINRPVNMWSSAGAPPGHPYIAEGWDDWGPFYTQTYMAYYGVDSSTVEMCSSQAGGGNCNGRLGGKVSQYVTVYSSLRMWIQNRQQMMHDQLEIFRRGVTGQARPACCGEASMTARGFTEDQHNWMVESPTAYIIPFGGGGQRSDAEANRMVRWLLDNGIEVDVAREPFTYAGVTYPKGSYVVWMNQARRGLALTALSPGQDISSRITQLYATPAAWSHGLLWGADVVEVPRAATLSASTDPVDEPNELEGGLKEGPADWYAVTPRGVRDHQAIRGLLRGGIAGEVAEEPFTTADGASMPAGTVVFPVASGSARDALEAAAEGSGLTLEPGTGPRPSSTLLREAPRVAILGNSASPAPTDTSETLKAIFGDDAGFVSVSAGANSLANAPEDPLLAYDVIYNTGQGWPAAGTARDRLTAFFNRGGGYIATSQSTTGFSFLSQAGLVSGSLTQSSQTAYGGIAVWNNAAGAESPVTGPYPASDFLYLPSNVTYFTATPAGSVAAGRYHSDMSGPATSPNGPSPGFVAGLWRTRGTAANSAPVIVHGSTTAGGRYFALATNPFSRQDAEREWPLIAQAALWSNLTDDPRAGASAAGTTSAELTEGFSLPLGVAVGSPELPPVTGDYRGEWRASDGSWGYVDAILTRRGSLVTGRLALDAAGCDALRPARGALRGPELGLSTGTLDLDGTVEGGTISGTFSDACSGKTGTFEIYTEETRAAD